MATHAAPLPEPIQGVAFNQVPESDNEIHGDEVAKAHGFKGGLVPGVTISAYLCDPAVRAWGMEFLARGRSSIVVKKPLYDLDEFRVELTDRSERHYQARLLGPNNALCAEGRVEIGEAGAQPPLRRNDRRKKKDIPRPRARRETFEQLRETSMASIPANWSAESEMAAYFRDPADMPQLLRHGEGGAGYANMAFILGMTNWHLAANVKLGPWLHLQTECQCFAPVEAGAKLVVEGAVADLFERKGHKFVDVDVSAFDRDTSTPVMATRLRAIYELRGA